MNTMITVLCVTLGAILLGSLVIVSLAIASSALPDNACPFCESEATREENNGYTFVCDFCGSRWHPSR